LVGESSKVLVKDLDAILYLYYMKVGEKKKLEVLARTFTIIMQTNPLSHPCLYICWKRA
jgi:hypothetical protein